MRCIEFLRSFFSEFQILESEFPFINFSTAEFEKKIRTRIFGIKKRNQNSTSNGSPRNWNQKSEFPTKNIGLFWGPYTPSTASKIISTCLGGCCPFIRCVGAEQKASCGALGGHICWQWPRLAMVVLVDVGSWRLTSDRPTVGIVKIVYGSIFFHSYVDPIYSWHLTRQLNKEDLDLRSLLLSWFLCPIFNSR